jgi:hypothetical protein
VAICRKGGVVGAGIMGAEIGLRFAMLTLTVTIDALCLASTECPYKEKQCVVLIAAREYM